MSKHSELNITKVPNVKGRMYIKGHWDEWLVVKPINEMVGRETN